MLREWLARHFPASEPFRPERDFTVPIGAWIERKADGLGPLVARQAGVADNCEPGRVEQIFRHAAEKKPGAAAWHLLFYALWHRRHVEGVPAERDVFGYLS